jgi:ABC-type transporter Mla MlaB component
MTYESIEGLIVETGGRLVIQASMKMDSAAAVLAAAEPHVRAADCVLDLAHVPAVDSAALSVVLSLLRVARETGHSLSVVNAPAAFDSLAALYGVDDLFSAHLLGPAPVSHV